MFGGRALEYDVDFRSDILMLTVGTCVISIFISYLMFNCEHVCGNLLMTLVTESE